MKIWQRPPDVPLRQLVGKRTPNGLIWAHDYTGFFKLTQADGDGILSRSMIEEIDAKAVEDPDPEPSPERLRAWSILKSVSGIECHSGMVTDKPNHPKVPLSPGCTSSTDRNHGNPPVIPNEDQGKAVPNLLESEGAEVSLKFYAILTGMCLNFATVGG